MVLFFSVLLVGCSDCECDECEDLVEINADDIITMENLDDYMFRDDVQYIDLRNYATKFLSGYIKSFETISFFEYLDHRAFERNNENIFSPDHVKSELIINLFFDKDKAIFLFDSGCMRAGYLQDLLYHLGYERVYYLGGFYEYNGDHRVAGDGTFDLGSDFNASYKSPTTNYTYYMFGKYDLAKSILDIRFDILDVDGVSLRSPEYDESINYNEQLTILEDYISSLLLTMDDLNQDFDDIENSHLNDIPGYYYGFSEDFISLFKTLRVN